MKVFITLIQVILLATLARCEICRTAAVCAEKGKYITAFKRVLKESDFTAAQHSGTGAASGGGYQYIYVSDLSTWKGANEACELYGGTLPKHAFGDEKAYTALKAVMDAHGDKWGFWLPLSDKAAEGTWRWDDGSVLNANDKRNWGNGQPDDHQNQDCAYVARGMGYKWDDGDCSGTWQAICEVKA